MYCVTVTYPIGEDTHFNEEYYRATHLPLCERLFADFGYRGSILRTNQGHAPGAGGQNYASLDLLFDSAEQLGAALAAAGREISADVVNYTNVSPVMCFADMSLDLS